MYPTTRHYIEAISNPEGLFSTLQNVRSIVDSQEYPIFCSGNFGSVFKIDTRFGTKALKCFTRHQVGRLSAYERIAASISPSIYIVEYKYLENEIFVFDDAGNGQYYPLLLMEWVDGETLTKHIERAVYKKDTARLADLACKFEELSDWLLQQTFAHNDLKPDNVMIRTGSDQMVLIDYDGMFVESMATEPAREFGTEPFQSPNRSSAPFDRNVDNYSIAYIRKALTTLAQNPDRYSASALVDFTPDELSKIEENNVTFGSEYQYLGSSSLGFMVYKHSGQYGFVRPGGEQLTQAIFDRVGEFSPKEGLAAVCHDDRWGYIDRTGRVVIECKYADCTEFSEGMAAVKLAQKWGFIDTDGNQIVPPKYDNAWSHRQGRALVYKRGKYGFIGLDGRVAVSLRYDFAQNFTCEGVACVKVGDKYGYVNQKGRWWEKPIYDYAQSFRDGRAAVELNGREFFILFNKRK